MLFKAQRSEHTARTSPKGPGRRCDTWSVAPRGRIVSNNAESSGPLPDLKETWTLERPVPDAKPLRTFENSKEET